MKKLGIWAIAIAIAFVADSFLTGTIAFADEYVIVSENSPGGKIFYLPSNFDGTFGASSFLTDIGLRSGTGIGDFDNDGDFDFVAGTRQSGCPTAGACVSYYLFENLGSGSFVQTLIEGDVPGGSLSNNSPHGIAIADFDEDGFNDFVSGVFQSNFVYLFTNNEDNTFTRSSLESLPNPLDAKAGDFNEDGHMDFLIAEYFAASVHMYEGDGTGAFTKQFLFTVPGTRAASLAVGDYNEDGHLDVIVDDIQAHIAHMYFGDGFGNFALQGNVYVRAVQTYVDSFDFDKDGHLDLIITDWWNVNPKVYFKKGNGDGTFQPESVVASSLSTFLIVSAPPPLEEPKPKSFSQIAFFSPPLKQIASGTLPENVTCTEGLQIVYKSTTKMPACVKPETVDKLMERGWAERETIREADEAKKLKVELDSKFDPTLVASAKKSIPEMLALPQEILRQCKNVKSYSEFEIFTIAVTSKEVNAVEIMQGIDAALTILESKGYDKHPEVGPLIYQTRSIAVKTSNCIDELISKYGS